jgi:hypothetical protein
LSFPPFVYMATPITDTERLGASGSWDSVYREGRHVTIFEFRILNFWAFAALPPAFKAPDASTAASGMVIIAVASKSKLNLITESIGFPVVGTVFPTMVRLGFQVAGTGSLRSQRAL